MKLAVGFADSQLWNHNCWISKFHTTDVWKPKCCSWLFRASLGLFSFFLQDHCRQKCGRRVRILGVKYNHNEPNNSTCAATRLLSSRIRRVPVPPSIFSRVAAAFAQKNLFAFSSRQWKHLGWYQMSATNAVSFGPKNLFLSSGARNVIRQSAIGNATNLPDFRSARRHVEWGWIEPADTLATKSSHHNLLENPRKWMLWHFTAVNQAGTFQVFPRVCQGSVSVRRNLQQGVVLPTFSVCCTGPQIWLNCAGTCCRPYRAGGQVEERAGGDSFSLNHPEEEGSAVLVVRADVSFKYSKIRTASHLLFWTGHRDKTFFPLLKTFDSGSPLVCESFCLLWYVMESHTVCRVFCNEATQDPRWCVSLCCRCFTWTWGYVFGTCGSTTS